MLVYFMCFLLFLIGLYCVITKRNLLKMVIGVAIMEYAINLFIVIIGYVSGGEDPVLTKNMELFAMVDPLPQSVALTTIMIGLATLILVVAISIRLYEKYGTLDITNIRKLKG